MRPHVLVLAAAVTLGACNSPDEPEAVAPEGWSTAGVPTAGAEVVLEQERLEDQVTGALPVQGPLGDYDVSCDGDLAGIVGARQVCVVRSPSGQTGMLVEAIEIVGDRVNWKHEVFLLESDLEGSLPERITQEGRAVDTVDCPAGLPGEVDAAMTCTTTGGAGEVTLTVTGVDGLQVDFDFEAR